MRAAKFAVAIVLGALSACAGQETTKTGFLGDYSAMSADKDGALRQRAPANARIGETYRAFIVDDVVYKPGPKSEKLSDGEIAELAAHYKDAATKVFGEKYRLATAPGPGVMRVRLAITGIDKALAPLNYVTTPLAGPVSNGGASSESEIVDSATGVRLAALSTHTNATPFKGGVFEYYTRLGHAKSLLARHAAQLREAVSPPN